MSEISRPLICLSEAALQSAQEANVGNIGYDPAEHNRMVAEGISIPEATVVFGGIQRRPGLPVTFDRRQPYYAVLEPTGESRRLTDLPLDRYHPSEEEFGTMTVRPIPRQWTSAELSVSAVRGAYHHPSVARLAVPVIGAATTIGAAAGFVASPFLRRQGYELSQEDVAMGVGCIGFGLGAIATMLIDARRGDRYDAMQKQAKQYKPFPVYNTQGRLL